MSNKDKHQSRWPGTSIHAAQNPKDSKPIDEETIQDSPVDSKPVDAVSLESVESKPTDQITSEHKADEVKEVEHKSHAKTKTKTVKISVSSVNFRKKPTSESSAVLFQITEGTVLVVLSEEGEWLHVSDSQGRKGYVMEKFTEVVE
jgi:Bacterial SH3 domain